MSKYKIVQLAHPGKEWPAFSNSKNSFVSSRTGIQWNEDFTEGIREWNNLMSHKRKFIFAKDATYIDSLNGAPKKGDITFWGEWEPHSNFKVISKYTKDAPIIANIPVKKTAIPERFENLVDFSIRSFMRPKSFSGWLLFMI